MRKLKLGIAVSSVFVLFVMVEFFYLKISLQEIVDSEIAQFQRIAKKIYYSVQSNTTIPSLDGQITKLKVPFHKQEHALSCEIASLRMVLNYHGLDITEQELLNNLPFDTKEPRSTENLWGDPGKGFVGDIDGKMPNTGYGVYEGPIAKLASNYKNAKAGRNLTLENIIEEIINQRPPVVWGNIGHPKDISWETEEGTPIKAVMREHARVAIGFQGPQENPEHIILLDPIYGEIKLSAKDFLDNWATLDNRAVLVY